MELIAATLAALALALAAPSAPGGSACTATRSDQLGPFYVPGAPRRSVVGRGHLLEGVVRSREGCRPLAGARVEFWLANPRGEYDSAHRATVVTTSSGRYRFRSNFPPPYSGRPPHIHIRVSARGQRTLVTQFYPRAGRTQATLHLVLQPR